MDKYKEEILKKIKIGDKIRFKLGNPNESQYYNFTATVTEKTNYEIFVKNIKGATGESSKELIERNGISNLGPVKIEGMELENYCFTSKSGINMSTEIKHVKI